MTQLFLTRGRLAHADAGEVLGELHLLNGHRQALIGV